MILNRLREQMANYYGKDEVNERLEWMFCQERGCVPDEWVGDDLSQDIIKMFKIVWEAVLGEVAERTRLPEYMFVAVVEPSWEDTTWNALIFNPWHDPKYPTIVLHFHSVKAWHFLWDSLEDMVADLEELVDKCIMRLAEADVPLPPSVLESIQTRKAEARSA